MELSKGNGLANPVGPLRDIPSPVTATTSPFFTTSPVNTFAQSPRVDSPRTTPTPATAALRHASMAPPHEASNESDDTATTSVQSESVAVNKKMRVPLAALFTSMVIVVASSFAAVCVLFVLVHQHQVEHDVYNIVTTALRGGVQSISTPFYAVDVASDQLIAIKRHTGSVMSIYPEGSDLTQNDTRRLEIASLWPTMQAFMTRMPQVEWLYELRDARRFDLAVTNRSLWHEQGCSVAECYTCLSQECWDVALQPSRPKTTSEFAALPFVNDDAQEVPLADESYVQALAALANDSKYDHEWSVYTWYDEATNLTLLVTQVRCFEYDSISGMCVHGVGFDVNLARLTTDVAAAKSSEKSLAVLVDVRTMRLMITSDTAIPILGPDGEPYHAFETERENINRAMRIYSANCPGFSPDCASPMVVGIDANDEGDIIGFARVNPFTCHGVDFLLIDITPRSFYFATPIKTMQIAIAVVIAVTCVSLACAILVYRSVAMPVAVLVRNFEKAAALRNEEVELCCDSVLEEIHLLCHSFAQMNTYLTFARSFLPQSLLITAAEEGHPDMASSACDIGSLDGTTSTAASYPQLIPPHLPVRHTKRNPLHLSHETEDTDAWWTPTSTNLPTTAAKVRSPEDAVDEALEDMMAHARASLDDSTTLRRKTRPSVVRFDSLTIASHRDETDDLTPRASDGSSSPVVVHVAPGRRSGESDAAHRVVPTKLKAHPKEGRTPGHQVSPLWLRVRNESFSTRTVTVLFGNMIGYHAACSKSPAVAMKLMQSVLHVIQDHLCLTKGVLDFFHGDRVMATFNASAGCIAPNAKCAEMLLRTLAEFDLLASSLPSEFCGMRFGVAYGGAVCGYNGTESLRRFCVSGPVVNYAWALMLHAKERDVKTLFTAPAAAQIVREFKLEPVDLVTLQHGVLSRASPNYYPTPTQVFTLREKRGEPNSESLTSVPGLFAKHTEEDNIVKLFEFMSRRQLHIVGDALKRLPKPPLDGAVDPYCNVRRVYDRLTMQTPASSSSFEGADGSSNF